MKVKMLKSDNWLNKSGYTKEEEDAIYVAQLEDIQRDPRWYLDNVEFMAEYRLSWGNYQKARITTPLEYTNAGKKEKLYKARCPVIYE